MPLLRRNDGFRSLIEYPEQMKTVTQFPQLFVNLFESKRLLSQHLRDVDKITAPFNFAIMSHLSDNKARVVLYGREFDRVGLRGATINTAGRLSSQRFMGTLPVVLLQKQIETVLLAVMVFLRWGIVLKRSVHPFVASVLTWLTWLDALRPDPELNPPLRKLANAAQCQRRKRRPVVTANRLGQSILAKRPLEPGPNRLVTGVLQRSTQKQIAREVVAKRQRITTSTITQNKISLEIRTPDLIRSLACPKRFTIGRHSAAVVTRLNQPRTLEDLTSGGIQPANGAKGSSPANSPSPFSYPNSGDPVCRQ